MSALDWPLGVGDSVTLEYRPHHKPIHVHATIVRVHRTMVSVAPDDAPERIWRVPITRVVGWRSVAASTDMADTSHREGADAE